MDIVHRSVDQTALFKARVKMLNMRHDRVATQSEPDSQSPSNSENFALYAAHARQICKHIGELRDLIFEKRKSYLLSTVNAYGHDNFMSDSDRRQCDEDMESVIKQCSRLVRNLELQIESDPCLRKEDEYIHLKAVNFLLNKYLENVCHIVADLRSSQLRKTQNLDKFCRLGNLVNKYKAKIEKTIHENDAKKAELTLKKERLAQQIRGWDKQGEAEPVEDDSTHNGNGRQETFGGRQESFGVRQRNLQSADIEEDNEPEPQASHFQPEFAAQLTIENDRLFDKFSQRNNEIQMIEAQFSEMQKLQRTFADKVLEQEQDIEIVHEKTIYTLDNLDQANQFIRDAIKNSASRRVIALFCLIVLTFTLLFLDWYNP